MKELPPVTDPTQTLADANFFTVAPQQHATNDAATATAIVATTSQTAEARLNTVRCNISPSRYEVLSLLGAGGMGEVYLAFDAQLDRKVALKLLSASITSNTNWLQRFNREAKAVSALNHPNILTIHDVGALNGQQFIATEYIEGVTLRRYLMGRACDIAVALDIATQLASALAAAHAANIVHRDIKPENIMVRPDGYVKLLDFGIAKPMGMDNGTLMATELGAIFGTAHYMSPEQARGTQVDARSDVFGLGVVLYEMLAGELPFQGTSTADVLVAILDRQPQPFAHKFPHAPPALEHMVLRALEKQPDDRYQNIADLERDLKLLQHNIAIRTHAGDTKTEATTTPPLNATHTATQPAVCAPEVKYAVSGDVNIAYQVVGDGPIDLVFVMGWISHLEYFWTEPSFARFLRRLATFARVILFDKRGTGLSDRVPLNQLPTLEQRMDDVRAVMDAVGSKRAVLCGVSEGGPMCSLFAATYPEKTIALVMMGSYARRLQGEGYPWGPTVAQRDQFLEQIRAQWGGPVGLEERAPSMAQDPTFRAWWAAYLRHGASPNAAVAITRMNTEIDIRHVLPTIRVPTLVVHRTGDACLKIEEGRYLANNIPNAKFVELPGIDHLPFVGPQDEILDEIELFLAGVQHISAFNRVLATVLSVRIAATGADAGADTDTDININANTNPLAEILQRNPLFFKREVALFNGRLLAMEPRGTHLQASFDGPARAIRAACAICAAAPRLNVQIRAGLHTGECDVVDTKLNANTSANVSVRLSGQAVNIAKQLSQQANPGEILVSSTVKDLVSGSGIRFTERGTETLPEDLGEWRLFGVDQST